MKAGTHLEAGLHGFLDSATGGMRARRFRSVKQILPAARKCGGFFLGNERKL
jgi:hypothetical protein